MGSGFSSCGCGQQETAVIPVSARSSARLQRGDTSHSLVRTARTFRSINGSVKWEDWRSADIQILDYGDNDSDSENTLTDDDPEFEVEKHNLINSHHAHGGKWVMSVHAYGGPKDGPAAVPTVEDPRRLSIEARTPLLSRRHQLVRPGTARHNHRTVVAPPSPDNIRDATIEEQKAAAEAARFAVVSGVRRQVTRYHHNGNYLTKGTLVNGRYKQKRTGSGVSKQSNGVEEEWKSLCDSKIPVDRTTSADRARRTAMVPNSATYVPVYQKNPQTNEYNKPHQRAPLPQDMENVDHGYSGSEGMYTESSRGGSTVNGKSVAKSLRGRFGSDCDSLMTEELGSDIIEDYSGSMNSLETMTSGKGTSLESTYASPDLEAGLSTEDLKSQRPKAAGRHRSAPRYYCLDKE